MKLKRLKKQFEVSTADVEKALAAIPKSKMECSDARIFNEYINEEQEVFLLKSEEQIVALSWNSKAVKITEIICGDYGKDLEIEEFKQIIVQLIILFDANIRDFSGLEIAQYVEKGEMPADVLEKFTNLFVEGSVYHVPYPTKQDFYVKKDLVLHFEDVLNPKEKVEEEIKEVEFAEAEEVASSVSSNSVESAHGVISDMKVDSIKTNSSGTDNIPLNLDLIEKEIKAPSRTNKKSKTNYLAKENTAFEQISFDEVFEEMVLKNAFEEKLRGYLEDALDNKLMDWQEKLKAARANVLATDFDFLLRVIEKASKKQVLPKISKYTLEDLKKERPLLFDDNAIKIKLIESKIEVDMVNFLLRYRQYNLNRFLKENDFDSLMMVHKKMEFTGSEEAVAITLAGMLTGDNVLLTGVASAGKSTLVETTSTLCNLPLVRIAGNADTTQDDLIGTKKIVNGEIVVIDAPMIQAIKKGYLFLFDELSSVDAQVASMMNPILDDQKVFTNPLDGQVIPVHPDFRCTATINDASLGYAGTTELNTATKSRFITASVDYVDEVTLEKILENTKSARSTFQEKVLELNSHKKTDIRLVLQIAEKLREAYDTGEVSQEALALRSYKSFLNLAKVLPVETAIMAIINKMDEDEIPAALGALESVGALRISDRLLKA